MPDFGLYVKKPPTVQEPDPVFERMCLVTIPQATTPIETILALQADQWLSDNGGGTVEVRNEAGQALVFRLTR